MNAEKALNCIFSRSIPLFARRHLRQRRKLDKTRQRRRRRRRRSKEIRGFLYLLGIAIVQDFSREERFIISSRKKEMTRALGLLFCSPSYIILFSFLNATYLRRRRDMRVFKLSVPTNTQGLCLLRERFSRSTHCGREL